jgi:hypothetical protein
MTEVKRYVGQIQMLTTPDGVALADAECRQVVLSSDFDRLSLRLERVERALERFERELRRQKVCGDMPAYMVQELHEWALSALTAEQVEGKHV